MMEWVAGISQEQKEQIDRNPSSLQEILSGCIFTNRNAISWWGCFREAKWYLVIQAPAFEEWQWNEKGIAILSGAGVPASKLLRIEPADLLHRTGVLMNTSMIDEKWCRPVFSKLLSADDQVCILAFSFFDDTKNLADWNKQYAPGQGIWYRANTDVFFAYGLSRENIHWINYFSDSIEEMKAAIANSNVLLLTGGAPDLMMKRIREKKLAGLLRRYQGLVIGYSAGAMVQLGDYHISPDEDYPTYSWQKGLGYWPQFDVEVHYRASRQQLEAIERTLQENPRPLYAIYEQGGMVVDASGNKSFFGKVDSFDSSFLK